ncbi:protease Do [Corallococcus macrosporus]|uniref:Protease Do n=1 Tax=Myxococcus fulvus (strain ATCC BAA-855 / HW-1) TaxID=483219 RepID=F8CB81_MYXFH|nr:protease Do [Corallococcus macrosporus]
MRTAPEASAKVLSSRRRTEEEEVLGDFSIDVDLEPEAPAPPRRVRPAPAPRAARAPGLAGRLRDRWSAWVPEESTSGARIAAVFLLVNAALTVAGHFLYPHSRVVDVSGWVSSAVDVALAVGLLVGARRAHSLMLVRLFLGLLLMLGTAAFAAPSVVVLQAGGMLGLLLLLVGAPGARRQTAGALVSGATCLILVVLLSSRFTQTSPLDGWVLRLDGALEPGAVTDVQGLDADYTLTFPATGWRQARPEHVAKMSPGFDRVWLLPARGAVVSTRVLHVPGAGGVDLDEAAEKMLESRPDAEEGAEDTEVVATEPIDGTFDAARRYHLRLRKDGQPMEAHAAVVVQGDYAFFIDAVAPRHRFASLDQELADIVASFAFQVVTPRLEAGVLDKVRQAAVQVLSGEASGSGFVIHSENERTLVITNDHVIREKGEVPRFVKVVMMTRSGRREVFDAIVAASDEEQDLALLSLTEAFGTWPALDFRHTAKLPPRSPLFVVGFPFGGSLAVRGTYPEVSLNAGWMASRTPAPLLEKGLRVVDVGINPGNSGGAVVDASGRVLGVAVAHVQGSATSVVISTETVSDWLRRAKDFTLTFDDRELDVAEASQHALHAEGEARARAATVLVRSAQGSTAGVIVGRKGEHHLLVIASLDALGEAWRPGTALPEMTVRFRPAQPESVDRKAEVLRASAEAGMVLLSVVGRPDDAEPLEPASASKHDSGTPVRVLGYRLGEDGKLLRKNPSAQAAAGAVASVQRDSNQQVRFLHVDVGVNYGQTTGPVLDAQGALVGLAVARVKNTNVSLVLPGENLVGLLRGGIRSGGWKLFRDRDGRCALSVLAVLDNPLGVSQTVQVRMSREPVYGEPSGPAGVKPLGEALIAADAGHRSQLELTAEVDCAAVAPSVQLGLVDSQGSRYTAPGRGEHRSGGMLMGLVAGTSGAGDEADDMVEFFLSPVPAPGAWGQECAEGDAVLCRQQCDVAQSRPCLRLGRLHLEASRHAEALAAFTRSCSLGNLNGCIELGLASQSMGSRRGSIAWPDESEERLRKVCQASSQHPDSRRACWALRPESYDTALSSAVRLCASSRVQCTELGHLYLAGSWNPQRFGTSAAKAFSMGCETGDAQACLSLARLQLEGVGVPRNIRVAMNTFEKHCQQGRYLGCEDLARMHATGLGVPKNLAESRRLMREICRTGVSRSPHCEFVRHQARNERLGTARRE